MQYCKDCVHYTQRGTSELDSWRNIFSSAGNEIGYCLALIDNYGNPQKVRGLDSCNLFQEAATASNSGYTRTGGCFLTSACVDYMGKSDDCYELTTLRKFRDDYMKSTIEGRLLVEKYYQIAPAIVKEIDGSNNKNEYYKYIYSIISECLHDIELGKNESALKKYQDMVLKLQNELLGDNI